MHAHSRRTRLAALAAPTPWPRARGALNDAARRLRRSWLGRAVAALAAAYQARLAIDELRSCEDHRLRDIGLDRTDIERAVRGAFRPLPHDSATGRERPPRESREPILRNPFITDASFGCLHLALRTRAANENAPLEAEAPRLRAIAGTGTRSPMLRRLVRSEFFAKLKVIPAPNRGLGVGAGKVWGARP